MRGQTTLDFALGVSVFLLTVLAVFAFIPATLQPFTQSAQEETVATDRVADLLVTDLLSEPGQPYLLDPVCTAALFSDTSAQGCAFDGASLQTRLDLPDHLNVNLTITGQTGSGAAVLCWNATTERIVAQSDADCDVAFRAGNTPPAGASTVTARRVVAIKGTTAALEVRMW